MVAYILIAAVVGVAVVLGCWSAAPRHSPFVSHLPWLDKHRSAINWGLRRTLWDSGSTPPPEPVWRLRNAADKDCDTRYSPNGFLSERLPWRHYIPTYTPVRDHQVVRPGSVC